MKPLSRRSLNSVTSLPKRAPQSQNSTQIPHEELDLSAAQLREMATTPDALNRDTRKQSATLQLQRMVGNQATQRLLNLASVSVQRAPDAIEVDIIEIPAKKGWTPKEVVRDTLNATESHFIHYDGALEIFAKVVETSSKEEAAPKSTGLIALEEVTKFVFDKAIDKITGMVPGGAVVKGLLDLAKSTTKAIEDEKSRSEKATEDNALKDFINDLRKTIRKGWTTVLSNKEDDAIKAQQIYDGKTKGEKEAYFGYLELLNKNATDSLTGSSSMEALFELISESWISKNIAPGKKYPAEVVIKLDKNWQVLSAYLDAPRGSRIAEELAKHGALDLNNFDAPRSIYWYPQSDQKGGGLSWCSARLGAKASAYSDIGANVLGQHHLQAFVNLLASKPIPDTTKISGKKS